MEERFLLSLFSFESRQLLPKSVALKLRNVFAHLILAFLLITKFIALWTMSCENSVLLFVREGIHSVADYNSTLMGVVGVVVVVVVNLFHDGITRERFELSS